MGVFKLKPIGITEKYTFYEIVWDLSMKEQEADATTLVLEAFLCFLV